MTQFELLTAAAFAELARREVEVAVVEAGLGGRWDATNVLGAPVVVLTNVGLEHTRWLGPTIADIAGEKLAVVRAGRDAGARRRRARGRSRWPRRRARRSSAARRRVRRLDLARLPAARNFAAPRAAAAEAPSSAARSTAVVAASPPSGSPAACRSSPSDPLTIYDGAHNAPGIAALAALACPRAPSRCCRSSMTRTRPGCCARCCRGSRAAVFTRAPQPARAAAGHARRPRAQGRGPRREIEPDPRRAVERARELAGPNGTVLATGSIYLVADLLSAPGERRASAL